MITALVLLLALALILTSVYLTNRYPARSRNWWLGIAGTLTAFLIAVGAAIATDGYPWLRTLISVLAGVIMADLIRTAALRARHHHPVDH